MKWKDRRDKTAKRTKKSADNREAKLSSMFTFRALSDREVRWADKPQKDRNDNRYDILPFVVSEEWYADLRAFHGKPTGLEVGDVDYKLEYASHSRIGPEKTQVLCLRETFGRACPICEERDRLQDNQEEEDPEGDIIKNLKPKWRTLYNIIDLNSDDEIRLWDYSYHLFEKILLDEVSLGDGGLQYYWDLEEGQTVIWRGKEKKIPGSNGQTIKFVEADRVDFDNREPYNEDILDEVYPLDKLLVIPSYDDVVRILTGNPIDNQEEDQPKKESKKRNRGSRYKKEEEKKEEPANNDDNNDNDDNDDDNAPWNDDDTQCPNDHKFGTDFNTQDECQECPDEVYNSCQDESEQLIKKEPEKKKEKKKERSTRRDRKKTDDNKSSGGRERKRRR